MHFVVTFVQFLPTPPPPPPPTPTYEHEIVVSCAIATRCNVCNVCNVCLFVITYNERRKTHTSWSIHHHHRTTKMLCALRQIISPSPLLFALQNSFRPFEVCWRVRAPGGLGHLKITKIKGGNILNRDVFKELV